MGQVKSELMDDIVARNMYNLDRYFNLQMEDGTSFDAWMKKRVEQKRKEKPDRHPLNISRHG